MKKGLYLLVALWVLMGYGAKAEENFQGYPLTGEGAWCWFADPRAVHYTNEDGSINASYIGYIDVHGNVKAMQLDYNTGVRSEVLVRSCFQPDDHNNPTFLVLPDERVLIIYSRHTDEAAFYYRVSKRKGDITLLGEEKCIKTSHNTTYPSPFLMSDDPEHFYLCWRGIGWHPTIARLTLPDEKDEVQIKWGPYQMVQSSGARPYAKYYSNGKDKLYVTYTTGHPDNEQPNWVYFNVINLKPTADAEGNVNVAPVLEDIKGKQLAVIANGPFAVNKTDAYKNAHPYTLVDAPSNYRDWVWQIACDEQGHPVIAMVRINGGKDQHQYYYAKWTGSTWRLTSLADGGGRFHPSNTEYCYSGGEALDPENPNIIYLSIPTVGASGKKVYEIWKYELSDAGRVKEKVQITRNSEKNNVRPFVLPGSSKAPMRLMWMNGDYYYWIVKQEFPLGFPTAIHADYEWPSTKGDLGEGRMEVKSYDNTAMTATRTERLALDGEKSFTLHLNLSVSAEKYHGKLLAMGDMLYGLDQNSVKPYVKIGAQTYYSSNKLYTSDGWAQHSTGTGGDNWPTPLQNLNLTLTYDGQVLTVYRNGLIDQMIETDAIEETEVVVGGYEGVLSQAVTYNRALSQEEVKMLIRERALEALSVSQVTRRDLVLPVKVAGERVVWSSTHEEVLASDGTYQAPEEETIVTLSASVQDEQRDFEVRVMPRSVEDNLLLRYTFDAEDAYTEGGATYVKDKGPHAMDMQLMGKAKLDGTLNLTTNSTTAFATNGYGIVPHEVMDSLRSYTVLFAATPKSLSSQPRFYDFGYSSGNSLFFRANALSAGIKYNGGTTTMVNASEALMAGTTYQLAVTFDARSGVTSIYVNGQLVGSGTSNVNEPYMIAQDATCTRNYIGRTQWWDSGVANDNGDYVGTMDDFCVYSIALTAEEIALMQGIRVEDEALNVECGHLLVNPDFEGKYSQMPSSGTTADRAIYVPEGWTVDYTTRNENDMTILNNSCLYASLFSTIPTTQGGGKNAYLARQKWGTSTIAISQVCDTMPAGYYRLTADLWQSGGGGNAELWTKVGKNSPVKNVAQGSATAWQKGRVAFTCNGVDPVQIGFSAVHATNGTELYVGVDNLGLLNVTANCDEVAIYELLASMTTATKKLLSGTLSDAARKLLNEALAVVEELSKQSSHDNLIEGYYTLRDALAQRNSVVDTPDTHVDIPAHTTDAVVYNLKGERVKANSMPVQKGVYIVNGEKVIVK